MILVLLFHADSALRWLSNTVIHNADLYYPPRDLHGAIQSILSATVTR